MGLVRTGELWRQYGNVRGVPLLSRLGSELSGYKDKGLVGMGTLSEGLETNPLHYALFSDRLWTREDISVREWLGKYARQRYGSAPKAVVKALEVLSSSIYNPVRSQEGCTESIICARPSWNVRKASTWSSGERYYHLGDIVKAARGYLKAANDQPNLVKRRRFVMIWWMLCVRLLRTLLLPASTGQECF